MRRLGAVFGASLLVVLVVIATSRNAEVVSAGSSSPAWVGPAVSQALSITPFVETILLGSIPAVIPQSLSMLDKTGNIGSYQPNGATTTASNSFFQAGLGGSPNGRTCFSCHQPQDGWALSPNTVLQVSLTNPNDALFQPVDGSDCPSLVPFQKLYGFSGIRKQLFSKANIRIFLPVPKGLTAIAAANVVAGSGETPTHWSSLAVKYDPYGCENDPNYGIPNGFVSMYRRPLPSANLAFLDPAGPNGKNPIPPTPVTLGFIPPVPTGLSPNGTGFAIMWDSREPTLESQFADAVQIHGQAPNPPTTTQINQGVSFQKGIFTAQSSDVNAGDLTGKDGSGATGGPAFVSSFTPPQQPTFATALGAPGPPPEFTLYSATGFASSTAARQSIARGEAIFFDRLFTSFGVAGLNDGGAGNNLPTTCNTCHNIQNVGNNWALGPLHTGIGDNSSQDTLQRQGTTTTLPPSSDQPLFTFTCPSGSIPFFSNPDGHGNDIFQTTDPGMALLTGNCADLGKMKTPILRGLASRAPYFHGGNAASLMDLVNFYDTRFNIGFTAQEKQDLVNFLNSL
jgi:cytochrome c peroxidase